MLRHLIFLSCALSLALACQTETASVKEPSEVVFVDSAKGKSWNIFGLEIVGKVMSEETAGQYSVVMSTTPSGGGPPLHVHKHEDELFYVLKGRYLFRSGEKEIEAEEGDLIFLPRNIPHTFKNVGETEGILMNTISPGGFEQFFEEVDQLPKDQPLDREKVKEIATTYGLTFIKETVTPEE